MCPVCQEKGLTLNKKVRLLELADHVCHKMWDPYINAKPFGHHLPGWGLLQVWQWHLCNYFENSFDDSLEDSS